MTGKVKGQLMDDLAEAHEMIDELVVALHRIRDHGCPKQGDPEEKWYSYVASIDCIATNAIRSADGDAI